MTNAQKIALRLSEVRQRLNAISGYEGAIFTAEIREESDALGKEYSDLESRHRAAIIAEGTPEIRTLAEGDAEHRERVELRSKANLTNYLTAAAAGRLPSGAESELAAAAGVGDGHIPLELWDVAEERADVTTGTPSTVGVNLDSIRPAIFANAILPRLGVEMPRVESGTYANATIATSLTADAIAQGASAMSSEATFNVSSTTPKRITGRLTLQIEDIAAVGVSNFESALRENMALVMSDALDIQGLTGNGSGANLTGLLQRLANPTAAPTAVADFDAFAAAHANAVDGLWASTIGDVSIVCGPTTYALAAKTFQSATNYKGELSAASYAMANTGGLWTNKRMPDARTFMSVANSQQAIIYRKARSFLNMGAGGMRTAVCPHWNAVSIDDIYSGSAAGERHFTMHVLLGDVILVQPDAYQVINFRVA